MPKRNDERPRHQQIAADLREQIMAGELPPGTPLPSTHRLVEQYSAANPTIQEALLALKDEGFLFSQQGKGVYVLPTTEEIGLLDLPNVPVIRQFELSTVTMIGRSRLRR